ncbi:MAG: hypothetical protein OXK82_02565 [Deltaproteobacteria bacterium]|nr:hypothetical protein [Deltaproteobacteria bacterium]
MGKYVERTCTEVLDGKGEAGGAESRPLAAFRDCSAYVLLGAPGAGKTESFTHEAAEGAYCDVRDFTFLSAQRWDHVETLFIDGLDELRVTAPDPRTPLDAIRGILDAPRRPRFRLSCREADWFGAPDRRRLESVSPDGAVKVLRLDPLSEENIRDILDGEGLGDIDHFVSEARDRGLGTLLLNPQTLKLLAAAVADGNWPATRKETFEGACRTLIRERNEEYLQAAPQRADPEMLLTAGRLCAVQLLSGETGYRLPIRTESVNGYIDLRDIQDPSQETFQVTRHTNVFNVTNGLAKPVHRHIAEFLAGRYLAALIDDHLPVRRVLALLTGDDGRPVSGTRGLGAWFAAHCKAVRDEIMERDPLGTVLYGDVRKFTVGEKHYLLRCLERDAERDPQVFGALHDLDSRWQDLATPDMENTLREILTSRDGGQGKQTIALAVLRSLERNAVVPGVTPVLLDVVRDGECWPAIRDAAFEAYLRQSRDEDDTRGHLKTLLADVCEGVVPDPLDDLLGLLLKELYPEVVPPSEVGRCLHERKSPVIARYAAFWGYDIVEQSTDPNQLAEVLDSLVERFEELEKNHRDAPVSYWLRTIPARILAAYLKRSSTVDHDRLFVWLGLAAKEAGHEARAAIRAWLSEHPSSYKAVVRLAADRVSDSSDLHLEVYRRLFSAAEPPDFDAWCLGEAAKTETNTEAATEFFLDKAAGGQNSENRSGQIAEEHLEYDPDLLASYRKRQQRKAQDLAEFTFRSAERKRQREAEAQQQRTEWRQLVNDHQTALRENRVAPTILHQFAATYLGWFVDIDGADGHSRLRNLLGDHALVDIVIEALRASTTRVDLPDVAAIFRLGDEGRQHLLMLPVLVGLSESSSLCPGTAPLDEQGMRRALAFLFSAPDFWNQEPKWFRPVLTARPELVADVLIRSVRADLRRGSCSALGLYELAHDQDYQPVADLAVVPLLKSFPTRHKIEQLQMLKVLLHAAWRRIDHRELLQIVEDKLALRSMDSAQQMYWICTGLLTKPALFTDRLREKLTGRGHERRVRRVAEFLYDCDMTSIEALDVVALEMLVESLGNSYRPIGWTDDDSKAAGSVARNSEYKGLIVDSLLKVLATKPSHDATNALQHLSENRSLSPWRLGLQNAAGRQREVRREANFRHPTVHQVVETLGNRRPANPTDLAALTVDVLADLAGEMRHGNTSDWRQYWNLDSNKRPQDSRHEDACRDALLSDLRQRLAPKGVDTQPEGTYADDKRADIRVWRNGFNVPVEIKKSTNDDLWKAIRNQLIAKYTRDPEVDGYGIYLVFWFGRDRCKRPPTGPTPETPEALQDRLLATANLSPEERRKISVIVIDVSKPES